MAADQIDVLDVPMLTSPEDGVEPYATNLYLDIIINCHAARERWIEVIVGCDDYLDNYETL